MKHSLLWGLVGWCVGAIVTLAIGLTFASSLHGPLGFFVGFVPSFAGYLIGSRYGRALSTNEGGR